MGRRAKREGKLEVIVLGSASHQKSGKPERNGIGKGEAQACPSRDEARPAHQQQEGLGREGLLTQVLSRENMAAAWKRVKANKGSAGVDGLSIDQTVDYLKDHWPKIRAELFAGEYLPQAVRRVEIPKPGGGKRELGIPTTLSNCTFAQLIFGMG